MKLVKVAKTKDCPGRPCPTLYRAQNDRYFVQGYKVDKETEESIDLPEGELLVEIDKSLIQEIAQYSNGNQ